MIEFNIEIANIPIKIICRCDFLYKQSTEYLTDKAEIFSAFVSDRDIEFERELTKKTSDIELDDCYFESVAIYRRICNKLYDFNAFLLHSAVIDVDGNAIAFIGKSGAGKTTQSRHWINTLGATYINGDKPIIRRIDGKFYAFGTPWCGKENYNSNKCAPLKAIVQVHKSSENRIEHVTPFDAVPLCLSRIHYDKNSLSVVMDMLDDMLTNIPFFNLYCNLDPVSAKIAYDGIKKYYEDKL